LTFQHRLKTAVPKAITDTNSVQASLNVYGYLFRQIKTIDAVTKNLVFYRC